MLPTVDTALAERTVISNCSVWNVSPMVLFATAWLCVTDLVPVNNRAPRNHSTTPVLLESIGVRYRWPLLDDPQNGIAGSREYMALPERCVLNPGIGNATVG
jgi:hypothetical protein